MDIYNSFNEDDVRMIAHQYLLRDYEIANTNRHTPIYEEIEAYTISGKRADGFLAIRTN